MAREVNIVLAKIIAEQRGIPEAKGEEVVKAMRSASQYQVCSALCSWIKPILINCYRRMYGHDRMANISVWRI
jgi:hypothetical protein